MKISIVVPCKNEGDALPVLLPALASSFASVCRICDAGSPWEFEIVLVDDGSDDGTLTAFKDAGAYLDAASVPGALSVRWISFSRNFGKEAGILAGLEAASGDLVATMDADMQDPPDLLPEMVTRLLDGDAEVVAARRVTREHEPVMRSWSARCFYMLMRRLTGLDLADGARDYRLMKREVVDAVLSLRERNRFSKGVFSWVGFKTEWLPYENVQRAAGETAWSFFQLVRYAVDGIASFTSAPLYASFALGSFLCAASLLAFLFIFIRALVCGDPVAGWPSLACIIVFLGGLQLFCVGLIGFYLAKTYEEAKRRPHYIVRESGELKL
ncbi:glycosyltransferase family 2 protein [Collinsella vaginalis]|uniref:glycosyltransferase family 2 protein n=1 Tax=Collinsella vaginalis TaxID=1870987 RepID=UPI000A270ABF|nr:glycosyltransferase family 2 protein [Collinsella vaginalis]